MPEIPGYQTEIVTDRFPVIIHERWEDSFAVAFDMAKDTGRKYVVRKRTLGRIVYGWAVFGTYHVRRHRTTTTVS